MILYRGSGVSVDILDREEYDILWVGLSRSPDLEEMGKLVTVAETWARNTDRYIVLQPEQVSEKGLSLPDIGSLLLIVKTLLDNKMLIRERLVCTCVRTKKMDKLVCMLKDQFLSLYKPIAPFDVVETGEEAEDFIRKCWKAKSKAKL